ncbi:MAG: C-type lectin domain-containing protein [Sandaracinus sp.]|nr:C-type lectin domain-containing protein [Myxococcales bacterium]MCB9603905.1 C-type lectin domain-containing protein [Sandaracinus sp.]
MTRVVMLLVFGVACSASPEDGQFLCSDGVCPAGQVCVAGVCRDSEGDLDAGERDGGVGDASTDGDVPDAPDDGGSDDASVVEETCTPTNDPQVDEDGDGLIDEGCTWSFSNAHPVLDVPVGAGLHWSPAVGGDGTRLYFGYSGESSGVYLARRTSVDARFELGAEPLLLLASPNSDPVFVVAIDQAETTLVAQVGGVLFRAERPTAGDAFGAWIEIGNGTHPTLRGDGLELIYVQTDRLVRATRSASSRDFGPPSSALESAGSAQFPRVTPDGRTLFYQGAGGSLRIASRPSNDVAFSDDDIPTGGFPEGSSFSVHPPTREVFFVAVGEDGPATQSIWRAEVCRNPGCPPRRTECPLGFEAVGTNCYERSPSTFTTLGAARDYCMTREATLASVASFGERINLERTGMLPDSSDLGSVWTGGVTESLVDGLVDYAWPTDEAFVEYPDAWATRPGPGDLMSRCIGATGSGWVARSCAGGASVPALCQIVRWPTWPHP